MRPITRPVWGGLNLALQFNGTETFEKAKSIILDTLYQGDLETIRPFLLIPDFLIILIGTEDEKRFSGLSYEKCIVYKFPVMFIRRSPEVENM